MEGLLETPALQTFIRVAEVWAPDGDVLRLIDGSYGALSAFAAISQETSFARGGGLPGQAWAEQRPVVLKELASKTFLRREAAAAAGLTSGVAIPVFAAAELRAVLVLLCGTDANHAGAIEIWEDRDGRLVLDDGFYGDAESLAAVSRTISFGHGQGLPGGVWAAKTPILMRNLAGPGAFIRSDQAREARLETGLGVPIPVPGGERYVLTLLSARHAPIARRFELWDARPQRVGGSRRAELIDGMCERQGGLWSQQNPPVDPRSVGMWDGPIGQVLGTGLPRVQAGPTGLPAGYEQMIALPLYQDKVLAHVVAWYF